MNIRVRLNIVIEFIESSYLESMSEEVKPPKNAKVLIIDSIEPHIVLTILGHEDNLLIRPNEDGFTFHHYNNRYSTNIKGLKYRYEAYGKKG